MSTRKESLLWARWSQKTYLRLVKRKKLPIDTLCNECSEPFPRINGLSVVVKTPAFGLLCPHCATSSPHLMLPKRLLQRRRRPVPVLRRECYHSLLDPAGDPYGLKRCCQNRVVSHVVWMPTHEWEMLPGLSIHDVLHDSRT